MFDLAWLLFAFPAAGALIILLLGPRLPMKVVGWVASLAVLGAFALPSASFSASAACRRKNAVTITYWQWMTVGNFNVAAAIWSIR